MITPYVIFFCFFRYLHSKTQLDDFQHLAVFEGNQLSTDKPSIVEIKFYETYQPLIKATLPHNSAFKPIYILEKQKWVMELHTLLLRRKMKSVVLTTSTWGCATQLLRWLISARLVAAPPLDNILVLSYDKMVHDLLLKRNFATLYLNVSEIFHNPSVGAKNRIFLSRLLVIQVINNWGISVFHCDTDALLLKNPFEMFEKHPDASIIASRGRFPFELGENGPWKYTACMGAILFRGSPHTDVFWMAVHSMNVTSFDDQVRINYAMKMLNIIWTSEQWRDSDPNIATGANGFKIVILPSLVVCRETCMANNQNSYYIWHSKKKLHFNFNLTNHEILISTTNENNVIGDDWLRKWRSGINNFNHYSCNA